MRFRNHQTHYGCIAITLHWLMAPGIIGLFALGWWMRQLSYYDPWYQKAPDIHKSIGILMLFLLVFRLLWRTFNPSPQTLPTTPPWQTLAARLTHGFIYLILLIIMLSGYLISTADGRAIEVFGWFSLPSTIQGIPNQEDIAGRVHEILAWSLMALIAVHALAALKHHFINRDTTLLKMLGTPTNHSSSSNRVQKQTTLTSTTKETTL
ncbi:cytochrome b [Microbulbifer spongiae]|uniref:Cytochrome b n=1 Tax=Microbulbifer spongiae TaxID=2944933 RepID=A0ABY9EEK0_9GAMM|nr:cytochrome b [Microbulbifer sp. MI-G]WKD50416.1 cytochrome b [Microbulbifer sp. MI-G]